MRDFKKLRKLIKEDKRQNVCIDIDGVLLDKGSLVEFAKEAVDVLRKKYRIVILTARVNIQDAAMELGQNGIVFDEITNKKVPAKYYIDDKGVHFTTWKEILPLL